MATHKGPARHAAQRDRKPTERTDADQKDGDTGEDVVINGDDEDDDEDTDEAKAEAARRAKGFPVLADGALVKATEFLFYNGARQRVGSKFRLRSGDDFNPKCMEEFGVPADEVIPDNSELERVTTANLLWEVERRQRVVEQARKAQEVEGRIEDRRQAKQPARPTLRHQQLQPNAVDPVEGGYASGGQQTKSNSNVLGD